MQSLGKTKPSEDTPRHFEKSKPWEVSKIGFEKKNGFKRTAFWDMRIS